MRLAVATAAMCAVAVVIALAFAAGHRQDPAAETVSSNGFAGAIPPKLPVRDFALRDQDGRRISLHALRGQVVVLTFLYSTCRDTCPITAQQIRGALDQLGHDVPVLAVSVDPRNDTPQHAQAFVLRQRMTGRMHFLLGTRAQLAPIWKAYAIQPQTDRFEHSAYVMLIDRHGIQRVDFPVDHLTPEGLAHDIRKLEAERS